MVLWGGLRPIASRVVLDSLTLAVWLHGSLAPNSGGTSRDENDRATRSYLWILLSGILTIVTTGNLTNRWTLTLPLLPLLVLQGVRRLLPRRGRRWLQYTHGLLTFLSVFCILAAAGLCVFFPAVELPPVKGPHNVGKVDLFLPLHSSTGSNNNHTSAAVWVRLLYPTLATPRSLPYLTPSTALEFCHHSMKFGAPPPLRSFSWMLHTWRLTERLECEDAPLVPSSMFDNDAWGNAEPLPVVVYSHGLGGHADIYSYQTHSLAAHGHVVLVLTHADGSSPVVTQVDGSRIPYDYEPQRVEREGGYRDYMEIRRQRTEIRVQEVVAATEALRRWNEHGMEGVPSHVSDRLALQGRLDVNHTTWMGHSFGGATVLTAAHRRPDLVHTVVAHEPVFDWACPLTTSSFFAQDRIAGLKNADHYHPARFNNETEDDAIHSHANMFFLFSHEWKRKGWALIPLMEEMQEKKRLGTNQTTIRIEHVPEMHHNEFSDTSMLTPIW
jgi:platelet-activating factor acetylhydrolase